MKTTLVSALSLAGIIILAGCPAPNDDYYLPVNEPVVSTVLETQVQEKDPIILLLPDKFGNKDEIMVYAGGLYYDGTPFADPGALAFGTAGDLSDTIETWSNVDLETPGDYQITYLVGKARKDRVIHVVAAGTEFWVVADGDYTKGGIGVLFIDAITINKFRPVDDQFYFFWSVGFAVMAGESITIKATVQECNHHDKFTGWSGDVSGTSPIIKINVMSDMDVIANFERIQ